MRLNSSAWHIFEVMRSKFYSPLSNSPCSLSVLDNITERGGTDHSDGMTLKILLKLPACHEYPINELLPMGIPLLGLDKYLTDVVNRPLNRILLAWLLPFHHNGYTDSSAIGSHI